MNGSNENKDDDVEDDNLKEVHLKEVHFKDNFNNDDFNNNDFNNVDFSDDFFNDDDIKDHLKNVKNGDFKGLKDISFNDVCVKDVDVYKFADLLICQRLEHDIITRFRNNKFEILRDERLNRNFK
ncbi:hypothetical protein DMUE_2944 [Dictyocoela muelleri]|nr:hypothetical protein DMUE_2944 [Dictyocoela muelleri]